MSNFFEEYFVKPIIERTGYNPVNTFAYGVLLIIGAYLLYKLFKKLGIRTDLEFFKHSLPFILFVSVWRSLTDAGVYPYNFFTTTPGLYVPVLAAFFPLLLLSKLVERTYKIPYHKPYFIVGLIMLASQLIFIRITQLDAFFLTIYFSLISFLPFVLLFLTGRIKNKLNLLMLLTHMFDATVTHVSISYFGYFEQHVVPTFFINLFGSTLAFYMLKLVILVPVIILLNKYDDGSDLNDWIRMVFIIYGIATGTRGFLRLSMGV